MDGVVTSETKIDEILINFPSIQSSQHGQMVFTLSLLPVEHTVSPKYLWSEWSYSHVIVYLWDPQAWGSLNKKVFHWNVRN